jgi:hypothetical protein
MDDRIEAFLADVLALEGEEPDGIRAGVRVALGASKRSSERRRPIDAWKTRRLTPPMLLAVRAWSRKFGGVGQQRPPSI